MTHEHRWSRTTNQTNRRLQPFNDRLRTCSMRCANFPLRRARRRSTPVPPTRGCALKCGRYCTLTIWTRRPSDRCTPRTPCAVHASTPRRASGSRSTDSRCAESLALAEWAPSSKQTRRCPRERSPSRCFMARWRGRRRWRASAKSLRFSRDSTIRTLRA